MGLGPIVCPCWEVDGQLCTVLPRDRGLGSSGGKAEIVGAA